MYLYKHFKNEKECLNMYKKGFIDIHSYIWVQTKMKNKKVININKDKKSKKYIM